MASFTMVMKWIVVLAVMRSAGAVLTEEATLAYVCSRDSDFQEDVWKCLKERYAIIDFIDECIHHWNLASGFQYLQLVLCNSDIKTEPEEFVQCLRHQSFVHQESVKPIAEDDMITKCTTYLLGWDDATV